MATNGGKRPGAGRKKGSGNKPRIADFFTKEEVMQLVIDMKKGAKKYPKIQMFLAEQIFGKAQQGIDLGDEFVPTQIIITANAKRTDE